MHRQPTGNTNNTKWLPGMAGLQNSALMRSPANLKLIERRWRVRRFSLSLLIILLHFCGFQLRQLPPISPRLSGWQQTVGPAIAAWHKNVMKPLPLFHLIYTTFKRIR